MEKSQPQNYFYTNSAAIISSEDDFIIKFLRRCPEVFVTKESDKSLVAQVEEFNVFISPKQFKKLSIAINAQLANHEKVHGPISIGAKKTS